ncbi:MAG: YHS domain-containing protein [Planctomycetota bacterium]|jgi:YHS domain-containing protein
MNVREKTIILMVLMTGVLVFGLVALNGCKKKSESATPGATSIITEQTTCPVMGNPINKSLFAEYKGKKVYFCCAGCVDKFKANPEQYIAKLPQFKN